MNRPAYFGRSIVFAALAGALLSTTARAQDATPADPVVEANPAAVAPAPAQEKVLTNFIETGSSYESLSNNFGDWAGGYARGVVTAGKNIWNAEINGQREFGDAGVYMDGGDTYNFNSDWYGSLTAGSSAGGFFWPKFRVDGFLNHKWLRRRQLITTVGAGYDMAKDVHRDHRFFVGTVYYFEKPWIIEDGIHFNVSNPGNVFSASGFVALTQGRDKHHYVTLNVGFGQEAYQIIGPDTVLSRFPSQTVTVTWRQWVGKKWGFDSVTDFYHSPFYHRGGGSLGIFRDF